MNHGLSRLGTLLVGGVLGATLAVVGLAQAGKLAADEPKVLVALGQKLEVEHRTVDLFVEEGNVASAVKTLESLRAGPWPDAGEGGEAAVQLRHDAYGRLLRLRLDHPEVDPKTPEQLIEIADEAMGDDPEPDANPFTARIWALRGEILEEQGRDDEALDAYERAIGINQILLERELSEAP